MDESKLAEQMARAFAEFTGGSIRDRKSIDELLTSLKRLNEVIKETNKRNSLFNNIIKNQTENYQSLEEAQDDYDNALKKSTSLHDSITAKEQRDAIEEEAARKNVRAALTNFSIGTITLTKNLVTSVNTAAQELVKNIQGGGTGVNVASGALRTGIDLFSTTAKSATGAVGDLGNILEGSANKKLRIFGTLLGAAGGVLGKLVSSMSDLAKFGVEILSAELTKNIEAYNSASAAGAIFARGVTDLRNAAHSAGMSVMTMSNIIKNNSETLYTTGMNIGAATKMISDVFVKGGRDFKISLFNLGYSLEEQGALVAETMKYLSVVGRDVSSLSSETIRKETEKYAINLKTISAITGDDAKKRIEESRKMAANSAIQAELAKMEPEARKKFLEDLAVVPENLREAVLQQRVLGTVVDRNASVLSAVMPEAGDYIRNFSDNLGRGTEAMGRLREGFASSYQSFMASGRASAFGIAALAGVPGTATDVEKTLSSLTLEFQKGAKRLGDTEVIVGLVDNMAKSIEGLNPTLSSLQEQTGRLTAAVEKATDPALKHFGALLERINNEVLIPSITEAGKFLAKLEQERMGMVEDLKKSAIDAAKEQSVAIVGAVAGGIAGQKVGEQAGKLVAMGLGKIAGRFIGGLAGSIFGPVGAIAGALAGDFLANKIVELMKDNPNTAPPPPTRGGGMDVPGGNIEQSIPGAARGAVLSGPLSGFAATLHGTEAVVPLPDGRTIPVSLTLPKELSSLNYVPPTVNDSRTLFSNNLSTAGLMAEVTKIKQAAEDIKQAAEEQVIPLEIKRSIEMSNNSLKEVLREQIDLMRDTNLKFEKLMDIASDTRSINQQLLNAAY